MRVAVYAICKNEIRHAKRWLESCKDADVITVTDTGSTDGTQSLLKSLGVTPHQIYVNPWRFDVGRNTALSLVPPDVDVCISIDMDEVLMPGWRKALEKGWVDGAQWAHYTYVYAHNPDGTPQIEWLHDRIHARDGFYWRFPYHESIVPYMSNPKVVKIPDLRIEHFPHPDSQKEHRANALKPLQWAILEYPNDGRMLYYYARQLMIEGYYMDAIKYFKRRLEMNDHDFVAFRKPAKDSLAHCEAKVANGEWNGKRAISIAKVTHRLDGAN